MAVDRLPQIAPGPTPVQPSRNVRQAQAAFFQAALGKAQGAAAPEVAAPVAAPVAATRAAPVRDTAPVASAAEPRSTYRPGSLLDIKI